MDSKQYIVPPDLGARYLIFGLTVPEVFTVIIFFFISLFFALSGIWEALLVPTTFGLLVIRIEGNPNMYSLLKIRFGYFFSSQHYSLNPWRQA